MADYDEKEDLMDRLLAIGKRKKFLSLDELHQEIPENMMSADDLEDVLERLEGANIPVSETDATPSSVRSIGARRRGRRRAG